MKQLVFSALMAVFWVGPAWGHGVGYAVDTSRTVCIRVSYDDSEPMSYAKVKVFGPGDGTIEHQNGRTDKNGRFAFVPDAPGVWRVEAGDGMGHGIQAQVDFSAGPPAGDPPPGPPGAQRPSLDKALAGLSVLFFLSGVLFWWKGRRSVRSGPDGAPE